MNCLDFIHLTLAAGISMFVTEKCVGSSGIGIFGIDYQGGKQPNINFELIGNTLYDTEGLRVIGNDRDNNTISMGHVIRGNTVVNKIDPPEPWLGPNATANPDWRSNHNMLAAIEVGLSEWYATHQAPQRHAAPRYDNRSCFQNIGAL